MINFLQQYAKEIISLIAPFIAWALARYIRARPKLECANRHEFVFLVNEPLKNAEGNVVRESQVVTTRSVIVRNVGRETANKLEVVFNWKPLCVNLWPLRNFEEKVLSDKRFILLFDNLAPSEAINIEILNVNGELPSLVSVRSADSVAKDVYLTPQPEVGRGVKVVAITLMLAGVAAIVYFGLLLLQFLVAPA